MRFGLCCLVLYALCTSVRAQNKFQKQKPKKTPITPVAKINTDGLPSLEAILEDIGLSHRLNDLIKMGVVDTRLLLRLKRMDYQIMEMDWPNPTPEEVDKLRETAGAYLVKAMQAYMPEAIKDGSLVERNSLNFGRFVMAGGVHSFDYLSASFGGRPPFGSKQIRFADPLDACSELIGDYASSIIITKRGNCTFLVKAEMAQAAGAATLAIVNHEDVLESVSSGLGVDKNVSKIHVDKVNALSIISMANTSWLPINFAHRWASDNNPITAQMVPLKCGQRGSCEPVTAVEKNIHLEVSGGHMRVEVVDRGTGKGLFSRSFDFLTSTFGSVLPQSALRLEAAQPVDACAPLVPLSSLSSPSGGGNGGADVQVAVVVRRGGCTFDVKARHVQAVGGRLAVVVDTTDNPLMRVGIKGVAAGRIGLPCIIVTAPAGQALAAAVEAGGTEGGSPHSYIYIY